MTNFRSRGNLFWAQGSCVFHLVACHYNFQDRVNEGQRKLAKETKCDVN